MKRWMFGLIIIACTAHKRSGRTLPILKGLHRNLNFIKGTIQRKWDTSNEEMQYAYFKKIKFLGKKGCISVLAIFVPVIENLQFYVCSFNFVLLLIVYICYAPFFFFFLLNHKVCLNYYLMNVLFCVALHRLFQGHCVCISSSFCVCAWMDVYFVQTKISVIRVWNKFFIMIIVLWFILYFTLHFFKYFCLYYSSSQFYVFH